MKSVVLALRLKSELADDVRRSFQELKGFRLLALESARPPKAGGLSFCAPSCGWRAKTCAADVRLI